MVISIKFGGAETAQLSPTYWIDGLEMFGPDMLARMVFFDGCHGLLYLVRAASTHTAEQFEDEVD